MSERFKRLNAWARRIGRTATDLQFIVPPNSGRCAALWQATCCKRVIRRQATGDVLVGTCKTCRIEGVRLLRVHSRPWLRWVLMHFPCIVPRVD